MTRYQESVRSARDGDETHAMIRHAADNKDRAAATPVRIPRAAAERYQAVRSMWFILPGVYLLALVPRLAVVLLLGEAPLSLDEIEYDRIAWNLSDGYGYTWFFELPTTFRPPGYPAFLAFVYSLFGADYYIGRIANALLAALQAPLTLVLGTLVFGRRTGLIAGVIVALYLPLVFYAYAIMSENLFIVLLLASLILTVMVLRSASLALAGVAGLAVGAAILTTSAFAAFLVFLFGFVVLRAKYHPGLWRRFALLALVALLVTVPWAVRNYAVTTASCSWIAGWARTCTLVSTPRRPVNSTTPKPCWRTI